MTTTTETVLTETNEQTLLQYFRPWLVCLSAGLFFFYEFIQLNMFNSLSTHLMRDFSLSVWQLGLLSNTYLMADVVFLLPAGIILDRFSVRSVILSAIMICVVGTLGFSVTHNIYLAGVFHFLSGIGNAFCFLSCIMLTSRWFEPQRQALVIGIIVTMAMSGGWIAQTPLAHLTGNLGWRPTVFIVALVGMSIMGLIYALVSDYPDQEARQRELANKAQLKTVGFWEGIYQAASNPQNWLCGIYTSFFNLPIMILGAAMGDLYLTQAHHLTIDDAAMASGMLFLGTIIGAPLAGWISDKMELRKAPMLIGGGISLAIVLFILYGPQLTAMTATVSFLLLGLFTSSQVISYPAINESNPDEIRGTALAISSVLIMGGAFVMTQVFVSLLQSGWDHSLVNNVPQYSASAYHFAMLLFPASFIVALVAAGLMKETNCRMDETLSR